MEPGLAKPKVRVLTRLHSPQFQHRFTSVAGDMAIWSVQSSKLSPPEALLATTHLPAKAGGHTDAGQANDAGLLASELAVFEDRPPNPNRNTILVGDFFMNPYDPGMTLATGIHALMTAGLACKPDRKYRKRSYRRFYNPMWGLFGDRTSGPAGTLYWSGSQPHNTFWAMFDQVLVRPALIGMLSRLEILDSDGEHSLLARGGFPDKRHLSDHLPIFFQLNI